MAVRISGTILPNKRLEISLTSIFGIGKVTSNKILANLGIDKNTKTNDLSEEDVKKLREMIEKNYRIEGDLKREVLSNIKRLKEINCYRGSRHAKKLPARGQRSKTNSRTVRGNKKRTMSSGRRKTNQKT